MLSFLSKHSTRDPGVCLDEIAIAIGAKGGNIQTVLLESEREVKPPPSISHLQWLDMHDWQERRAAGESAWEEWYQAKLAEIVTVVESDESRRFAGEIKTLEDLLKPIASDFAADARIRQLLEKKLVGRTWLFEAVEKWRTTGEQDSRLFWLMGAPGIGKSAFAAHLAHEYGRGTVLAVHFCDWKKPDHRDACRIIRTLAFQIATRLPDYRKLLLTLPIMAELDRKNSAELFDGLLTNPLKLSITGGRERYLIVIDALDEAGSVSATGADGRNELVEVLARYAGQLPEWIGLVVTSRPEFDVTTPFQALKPFPFETKSAANSDDIRAYLWRELAAQLQNRPDASRVVEKILEKSEGVFLYVESVCDDIRKNHLSLDRPNEFPQGVAGKFYMDFQRYFPDLEKFRKDVRPALRAILAAFGPLPLEVLRSLFTWTKTELFEFKRRLGSLFLCVCKDDEEVINLCHKSLADWLTDETKAGPYHAIAFEGHQMFVDYVFRKGKTNTTVFGMESPYWRRCLPRHLHILSRTDLLQTLLCEDLYLQSLTIPDIFYVQNAVKVSFTASYRPTGFRRYYGCQLHRWLGFPRRIPVFLSFAREDRRKAELVSDYLEANGFDAKGFLGVDGREQTRQAIHEASRHGFFLPFLSHSYFMLGYTQFEACEAIAVKMEICPIIVNDFHAERIYGYPEAIKLLWQNQGVGLHDNFSFLFTIDQLVKYLRRRSRNIC